ncbi:MAG: hypothetical protein ACOYL3_11845 [Desulfuromonadaceae bacterium]
MKKRMALLVGMLAVAFAGVAQAETRLAVQNAAGADKMVVTDGGYVGVGTNTPLFGIHVTGATANDTNIVSHFVGTSGSGGGNINMLHNNAASVNGGMPQAYDRIGNILFGSYLNATTKAMTGGLSAVAEATWTATSAPTFFSIFTTPSGSTGRSERVRIAGNGNVGIGTVSPTVKLQVDNGIRLTSSTAKPTCAVNFAGTMWFTSTAAGSKDILELCAKDANGTYGWRLLY